MRNEMIKDITIDNLDATLHYRTGNKGLIILLHGIMGEKDAPYRRQFANFLCDNGYNSLRFNFSVGSRGKLLTDDFMERQVEDTKKVVRYLIQKGNSNLGLVGACSGANNALIVAANKEFYGRIKSVVTLAAFEVPTSINLNKIQVEFHDYDDLERRYRDYEERANFYLEDSKRSRLMKKIGFTISKEAVARFKNLNIRKIVESIPSILPILFIVGDKDPMVSIEMTTSLYEAKRGLKSLEVITSRSHGYINPEEASTVNKITYKWFLETIN